MPDYTVGDTVFKRFTTRAFATGIPTILAGTPVVSAYEDDSVTQITAGITLGVDHDGVAGLNLLTIVATGGNGFESGKSYDLVITTGTVGGVTVAGEVVWHFTLGAEAAAVDLANATDGLGAIKTDTAAILLDTVGLDGDPMRGTDGVDTATMRGTDSAALASVNTEARLAELDAANIPTDLSDIKGATFTTATDSLEAIRDRGDAAWTTGAGTGLTALASGTAQGGTASTIQLAAGETFADDELNGNSVKITSGTGAGQSRVITDYAGATDIATVAPNWITTPDATSVYEVVQGSTNVTVIQNDSQSATDLKDFVDAGYNPATNKVQGVVLVDTTTINTDQRGTDGANTTIPPTATVIADTTLRRTYANARASSDGDAVNFRSLLGAIGKLVNRVQIVATTLTVFQEDDSTATAPGGTQTVTTDAAADPITQVDTV